MSSGERPIGAAKGKQSDTEGGGGGGGQEKKVAKRGKKGGNRGKRRGGGSPQFVGQCPKRMCRRPV